MTTDSEIEIVVGTYENFLLGYSLNCQNDVSDKKYSLKASFTNNSHCASIRSLCSVSKYIASGSKDEVIRLLNLITRREHGTLQQQNGTISCLTPFHCYLFSGSDDGTICIWKTGSWQCEKTLRAHEGGVLGISVHPSGKLALSIGNDKSLKTWNLIKGRHGYTTNLRGIAETVEWSLDGSFYAVSIQNRVDVYSLDSAKVIHTIPYGKIARNILFCSEEVLVVSGDKEIIEIHDVKKKMKLLSFPAHKTRVKGMKYLLERDLLITVSNADGLIKVWTFDHNFSKEPTLCTEINTTCRITCVTIWDKSLHVKATASGEGAIDQMQILEENESDPEESESDVSEDDDMEQDFEELEDVENRSRKSKRMRMGQ